MKKNIFRFAIGTAALLLIPLVLQWPWSLSDYVIMGSLIFGTGLLIELVRTKVKNTAHRVLIVLAILAVFFLVWAELAVGLFGTPFAGS
jgi:hypothetical protein